MRTGVYLSMCLLRQFIFLIVNQSEGKRKRKIRLRTALALGGAKGRKEDEDLGCTCNRASGCRRIELGTGRPGALRSGGDHLRHALWANLSAEFDRLRAGRPGGAVSGRRVQVDAGALERSASHGSLAAQVRAAH